LGIANEGSAIEGPLSAQSFGPQQNQGDDKKK